jgi:hypothetical protein
MDDFVLSSLHESKNEWCGRLVSILTPLVSEGIRSIFDEAWLMCKESGEFSKYLMTFQNMLAQIPKWNNIIVEQERKRIIEKSGCNYLEDLITCVHIIQLKVLTCIRVGNKQKKIDISIPKLDLFIHRVYIHVARKVYSNIYLFEKDISGLLVQKNRRELEIIIQECILNSIRESIPTEAIIRAYLDESLEDEEVVTIEPVIEEDNEEDEKKDKKAEEKKEEVKEEEEIVPEELPPVLSVDNLNNEKVVTRLTFNDVDGVSDGSSITAPKTIDRLEKLSADRNEKRKEEEEEEENEEDYQAKNGKLKIHMDDDIDLNDVFDLDKPSSSSSSDYVSLGDITDM